MAGFHNLVIAKYIILIFWVIAISKSRSLARTGCSNKCGNVSIPYPFGIGPDCYMNESYAVTCKDDSTPFLTSMNMELLGVSLFGYVRVKYPVIYSNCGIDNNISSPLTTVNLSSSPFYFSDTENRFISLGSTNFARMLFPSDSNNYTTTCVSIRKSDGTSTCVDNIVEGNGCRGINYCETTFPPSLQSLKVNLTTSSTDDFKVNQSCRSVFVGERSLFEDRTTSLGTPMEVYDTTKENFPAVFEWYPTFQGYCDLRSVRKRSKMESFCGEENYSKNTFCWAKMDSSHLCFCFDSYSQFANTSTTYITKGCEDRQECDNSRLSCYVMCTNKSDNQDCSCPDGYVQSATDSDWPCLPRLNKSPVKSAIVGSTSSLGPLILLSAIWVLHKKIKRRNELKLKQKFFKRNGGLLLQQQVSTTENTINEIKLFTSEELEKATDHYHADRILGQGGQGTVYKGMLTDGKIVAVKRSRKVDESKQANFINEVIILSQINHRNVVKLHGCCLETEVPLLVYEFIPNGTLFQYIHDQDQEFPLTWDRRLRIATEIANALSYLHSAASMPIYHRDIKTSNILLDEKYRAKVSDFGTSRSIAIDQTHLTTHVQGTFGYLDPEYFQSSQFTDKSDVYSFGVVLVELLTGQKPVTSVSSEEHRNLAAFFLLVMEENRLLEILDSRVVREGVKEEIAIVAKLAHRCLNLHGKNRPTMKEVARELEGIKISQEVSSSNQHHEELSYTSDAIIRAWDNSFSSSTSCLNTGTIQPSNEKPVVS